MAKMIFVNLPVTDLETSKAFYMALGATVNPRFTDENAAAMVFSDSIFVMLLTHAHWRNFTTRPIADAKAASQVLIALTQDSRDEVDAVVGRGAAAGGRADANPAQDHGFMYSRTVEDPDGHVWEMFWMDPAAATGEMPAEATAS